jgi:hypothetical protein
MRTSYDFARMKGRKNPFAGRLKRSVTIRLDDASIAYFKELAAETGVPYQSLINLYLRDCVPADCIRLNIGSLATNARERASPKIEVRMTNETRNSSDCHEGQRTPPPDDAPPP